MTDSPAACPICGKPATRARHPFCGTRCADVDLGRWLTGQYRVPGLPAEEAGGEQDQAEPVAAQGQAGGA